MVGDDDRSAARAGARGPVREQRLRPDRRGGSPTARNRSLAPRHRDSPGTTAGTPVVPGPHSASEQQAPSRSEVVPEIVARRWSHLVALDTSTSIAAETLSCLRSHGSPGVNYRRLEERPTSPESLLDAARAWERLLRPAVPVEWDAQGSGTNSLSAVETRCSADWADRGQQRTADPDGSTAPSPIPSTGGSRGHRRSRY